MFLDKLITNRKCSSYFWTNPKTLTYQQKKQIRRAFKFGEILKSVLPLPKQWITKPEYQWFADSLVGQNVAPIIFGLPLLDSTILGNMETFPKDISPLIDALNYLERFYFLVGSEAEKDDLLIIDLEPKQETKTEILVAFAKYIDPMIMSFESINELIQQKTLIQKTKDKLRPIFQNDIVKQAGTISGIGALIMLFGVLIFKIDVSQAFLTWFTITFGTLSISIGISSKKDTKSEIKD